MTVDYSVFARSELPPEALQGVQYDLLISAYNSSERVNQVFQSVQARTKHWLLHSEYDYEPTEYPDGGEVFDHLPRDEASFWRSYFERSRILDDFAGGGVAVDITGMMRPHVMLLVLLLRAYGWNRVDFIYSDPMGYSKGERTRFSDGAVERVSQVQGFEGVHLPGVREGDLLIIGTGYDDELLRRVAEDKRAARKVQMYGLPSLQPHMYQENHLNVRLAEESLGPLSNTNMLFAPANNPFMTAQVLSDYIRSERASGLANLYLCPLGTKPQVLGFALFYTYELVDAAASMIFPYAPRYARETSHGLARTSIYSVELSWSW